MDNEKALKVLEFLDSMGYLKGKDKEWFEKLINEPDTYKLWIDYGELQVSYAWDTEDFEYGFRIDTRDLGRAILDYAGIKYENV